ncbi:NAD(P)H-hydrate dehydratase [Mitsuokella sp. WILCCON 0060]|uniref:NAD(P)H-hydrate dehydratase n=1 Tax=unclassified Mitsuokella TaxID=2637239 RepID=UPI003F0C5CCB
MKISLVKEMREIDRRAGEEYGLPELLLMENAGRQTAAAMISLLGSVKGKTICVLAGSGNNGGDAFSAARYLYNEGAAIKLFLTGNPEHIKASPSVMQQGLAAMGISVHGLAGERDMDRLRLALRFADAILDGILGTGFRGTLRPLVRQAVELVNAAKKPVLSIDIPSGVEADTGGVADIAVKADCTLTLGLPKPGHFLSPGAEHAGKVLVDGIGIPWPLLEDPAIKQREIDDELAASLLPARPRAAHKGSCGRILAAAGSRGMTGAAAMCSLAALRAGCGIVTLAVPESLQPILAGRLTEVMTKAIPEEEPGILGGSRALQEITSSAAAYDAVLIGPGLGRAEAAQALVRALLQNLDKPLLLDADAIYALSGQPEILREAKHVPVLTPHLGEMARLLGLSVSDLREDLVGMAREAAQEYHAIFVVKSECTLVAYPDGQVFFTTKGNAGMATAGAGDVLAGTIAGLMKQMPYEKAPLLGVYLHGLAGDLAYAEKAEGLIAGDILAKLPDARQKLKYMDEAIDMSLPKRQ